MSATGSPEQLLDLTETKLLLQSRLSIASRESPGKTTLVDCCGGSNNEGTLLVLVLSFLSFLCFFHQGSLLGALGRASWSPHMQIPEQ